jgi:dimethylargininase
VPHLEGPIYERAAPRAQAHAVSDPPSLPREASPRAARALRPIETALTREVSPEIGRCELTFLERERISFVRAQEQHDRYCELLQELGLGVIRIPAAPGCPDSCFIEDVAVVLDEVAILTRMGAESRRPESQGVAAALVPYRRIVEMGSPATLDGGDVLRIGRKLFVGLSARTNAAGLSFVEEVAEPLGYAVNRADPQGCLHLKSAVTALDEARVLINPNWLNPAALSGLETIRVPPEEPWAANVLKVGDQILVHAGFERTIRLLEAHGFCVAPLDISEFLKAEGGLTCKSVFV